jgi:Do/DeqQ family serine protease
MHTSVDEIIIDRETPRSNKLLLGFAGIAVLIIGGFVGAFATAKGWTPFKGDGGNKAPVFYTADQRIPQNLSLNGGFSSIAKAVTPAVVTINTESRARAQRMPFFMDPFRDFFNNPDQDDEATPRRRQQTPQSPQTPPGRGRLMPNGVGSGVIVSQDGYILTNNHVVEGADRVRVELTDKRVFTAKVIGTDAPSDVAVLKIDASDLPVLVFGDSSQVEVGDIVLAVGNPLNVGQTITMGIVSAKSRSTGIGGNANYEDFLQTDAAINRGNSGGALVNLRGELIGIPSQILSGTGGNIGIGFAIPSVMARKVMEDLIKGGKVRRSMLGIRIRSFDTDTAEQFGYNSTKGALVEAVDSDSPAEHAGLKRGDIITEFQGQRIEESSQLRNMASQTPPGTTVKVKAWRDGSEREFSVKLVELNPEKVEIEAKNRPVEGGGEVGGVLSGIKVDNLTSEAARRIELPEAAHGVVITEVDQDSNAAAYGLRRGDVIEEVARQPVTNVNEFNAAIQKLGKKSVLLSVRNSRTGLRYVLVRADE